MRQKAFVKHLPAIALLGGILTAALRYWLYARGVDEKGLLLTNHPAHYLIWVVTALIIPLLFFGSRVLKDGNKFRSNFPADPISAIGCFIAAAGVAFDALGHFGGDFLQTVSGVLGFCSAAALIFIGFCRLKGRYPSVIFHTFICLYLLMTLVALYRVWSAAPQLQDYIFPLMASICVMLACYHDTAFAVNSGSRKSHTFFHTAAVYLCLASLPHNDNWLFYLTLAVWMYTGRCNLGVFVAEPAAKVEIPETTEDIPEAEEPAPEEEEASDFAEEPLVLPEEEPFSAPALTLEESFAALEALTNHDPTEE